MKKLAYAGWIVFVLFALSASMALAEDASQVESAQISEIQDFFASGIAGKAILLDGIHGVFGTNLAIFSDLINTLTGLGATVDTLNLSQYPITATLLDQYNALIVIEPGTPGGQPYTSAEKAAVEAWASNRCGDLFVFGDGSPTAITNWVSFAGITCLSGGNGGSTSDITSHCITTGVSSVTFEENAAYFNVSAPAVSLVRLSGKTQVAAREFAPEGNGLVVAVSDENVIVWVLSYPGNLQLALNAIDCGYVCMDCGCMISPAGNRTRTVWRLLPGFLLYGMPIVFVWGMKRRLRKQKGFPAKT
jgi:hypothetical protein